MLPGEPDGRHQDTRPSTGRRPQPHLHGRHPFVRRVANELPHRGTHRGRLLAPGTRHFLDQESRARAEFVASRIDESTLSTSPRFVTAALVNETGGQAKKAWRMHSTSQQWPGTSSRSTFGKPCTQPEGNAHPFPRAKNSTPPAQGFPCPAEDLRGLAAAGDSRPDVWTPESGRRAERRWTASRGRRVRTAAPQLSSGRSRRGRPGPHRLGQAGPGAPPHRQPAACASPDRTEYRNQRRGERPDPPPPRLPTHRGLGHAVATERKS